VTLAALIDGALEERVIVFGSLPPEGRDLDLLARPREAKSLIAFLRRTGFVDRGGEWVWFHDCTADSLDIVSTEELALPEDELNALFTEGREVPGFRRLVRPAPWHVLLLVAQRVAAEGGVLSPKRRRRLDRALEEEPDAWTIAARRAAGWNASTALPSLKVLYERPSRLSVDARPKSTRPIVIAFSGVDGSGKTTQLDGLRASLERLGVSAEREYVRIEWLTLTDNRLLSAVAAPAKAVARIMMPRRAHSGEQPTEPRDAGRALRQRSALVTHAWTLIVALAHARVQRRAVRKRETRVVICDRYTLDAVVWLRFNYGRERAFRLQTFVLRMLSRTPLRSYYFDVGPATALGRKVEHFGLAELEALRALYREECERNGVTLLDGERAQDDLCAEIARDVWEALRAR
jgi:thymidylate kinase